MSARFSLKITTLCHSVRSRGSPDWRSFQRSEVAIRRLTIFWLLWLWRTSGSRPRLPTRITLFTLPAIACPPPPSEASLDPACPSRRWAREPPASVKRGRAYQELLASNSECRRPLRLPREGRRQGQAGGERRPDVGEARRRHPPGRPPPAVHRRRTSTGGRSGPDHPDVPEPRSFDSAAWLSAIAIALPCVRSCSQDRWCSCDVGRLENLVQRHRQKIQGSRSQGIDIHGE